MKNFPKIVRRNITNILLAVIIALLIIQMGQMTQLIEKPIGGNDSPGMIDVNDTTPIRVSVENSPDVNVSNLDPIPVNVQQ